MVVAIHIGTAVLDGDVFAVPDASIWTKFELMEPVDVWGYTLTFNYADCFYYFTLLMGFLQYVRPAGGVAVGVFVSQSVGC